MVVSPWFAWNASYEADGKYGKSVKNEATKTRRMQMQDMHR